MSDESTVEDISTTLTTDQEVSETVKPVEEKVSDSADENAVEGGDQSESSEAYADFELPEGVELDAQLLEKARPLFKDLGLNQEQAQKLIDFQASQVQASQTGQTEAFNQLKEDWKDQSKNDKEIGGDKFEQSVSDAREALGKFGTPGLTELLNDYGVGNHPEIIRFMAKVGQLTKEDVPGSTGAAPKADKSRVDILYPSDS